MKKPNAGLLQYVCFNDNDYSDHCKHETLESATIQAISLNSSEKLNYAVCTLELFRKFRTKFRLINSL